MRAAAALLALLLAAGAARAQEGEANEPTATNADADNTEAIENLRQPRRLPVAGL